MKQTAVDFALEQLEKFIPSGNQIIIGIILEKAKQMEKDQIENAFLDGYKSHPYLAEQYYKETYGKDA